MTEVGHPVKSGKRTAKERGL